MAVSIGVLEVRNFGLESFDEPSRLAELQALIAKHGAAAGTQIWDDLNFLNDPLAPVTVPDPTTPGYGGPLALRGRTDARVWPVPRRSEPRFDYAAASARRRAAAARREDFASRSGAWPKMGSYAWAIAAAIGRRPAIPGSAVFRRPASRRRRSCTSPRTAAMRA